MTQTGKERPAADVPTRDPDSAASGGPPTPPSTALLLLGVGRLVREQAEARLRPTGSSLRHLSALGHLSHQPGLSYSELARRAGVTSQSMQATLRQLEDLGAVERRTRPGKGRAARLHVTAAGAELLRQGNALFAAIDQELLGQVQPDQRAWLLSLLPRLLGPASAEQGASGDPD